MIVIYFNSHIVGIRIFPQHNVSPKFCNFVCRSRSNILPTRDNLCKKKLIITPRCDICCLSPKTVGHLLWECPRLEMCGRCSEESCRSVVILYYISFYSSDNWLISLIIRTWSVGLWLLGLPISWCFSLQIRHWISHGVPTCIGIFLF